MCVLARAYVRACVCVGNNVLRCKPFALLFGMFLYMAWFHALV